ncbi:MAG: hypothetical protein CL845_05175 [Crocinitomicaceae bacterium]|nr:hypothetical protein [Crocinitomicaceae bacterium]
MPKNNDLYHMVKLVAYTHIWIAMGATAAAIATVLTHGYPISEWNALTVYGLLGIGIITGCIYTRQRRIKLRKNPSGIPQERRAFLEHWQLAMIWAWSFATVAWIVTCAAEWLAFFNLFIDHTALLFGISVLVLGYASNPFSNGLGWRDIPRLKWPVIALTWGLVTGWLPLQFIPWDYTLDEWSVVKSIGVQTLFIAGITLPFDVRDVHVDPANLRTVAQQTSPLFTTTLAFTLVLLSMGGFLAMDGTPARVLTGAVALVGILLAHFIRQEWIFSLWLDGCLILQGVLAFLLA